VPPDTVIAAAGAEWGEQQWTYAFPLAGRVAIFIGSGRQIPGETVIGEMRYGSALEATLAEAVQAARQRLSAAVLQQRHTEERSRALRPEHERLARDVAALKLRLDRLRQENDWRAQALRRLARSRDSAAPEADTLPPELAIPLLAERLRELFSNGSSRLLPAAGDDIGLLDRLLCALARLRPAGPAGRPTDAPVSARCAALLARLYAFRQAAFPLPPPGLPVAVPPPFHWQQLRKYHLQQLGCAARYAADAAPGAATGPEAPPPGPAP
jgi:hypothetical protein